MTPLRLAALLAAAVAMAPGEAQSQLFVQQKTQNASTPLTPPPADVRAFQEAMIAAVMEAGNRQRAVAGLAPLRWDMVLSQMADRFSHEARDAGAGERPRPTARALAAKLPQTMMQDYAKIGETVWSAQGTLNWDPDALATEAIETWSQSARNKRNLLEPAYTRAGVGVAFAADRGVFVTMMFGLPHDEARPASLRTTPLPPVQRPPQDLYAFARALPSEIVGRFNAERARRGLPPLRIDPALSGVALRHSEGMIDGNYFAENDAAGVSVLDHAIGTDIGQTRSLAVGLWHGAGGLEFEPAAIAGSVLSTWREKPGNMEDLLDPRFDRIGVGVATDGQRVLVTALYAETGDSGQIRVGAPAPQPPRIITPQQ